MMHEMHYYKTCQETIKLEDELKSAKSKIEELERQLEAVKIALERKDVALEDAIIEKENIVQECKSQEMCNKLMKQQLEKERKILERESQKLLIAKSNLQTKRKLLVGQITVNPSDEHPTTIEGCARQVSKLQGYNQYLQSTLLEREKTISTLCEKFLLLKHRKTQNTSELSSLKDEFDEISKDLLGKLVEAKNEINMIADAKLQDPLDKKNAALLQVVQKNGQLIIENSTLRLEVSQLKQSLKTITLENSAVDINTKTLEMKSVPSSHALNRRVRISTSASGTIRNLQTTRSLTNHVRPHKPVDNLPTRSNSAMVQCIPSDIIYGSKNENDDRPRQSPELKGVHSKCRPAASGVKRSSKSNREQKDARNKNVHSESKIKHQTSKNHDRRNRTRRNRETQKSSSNSSGNESSNATKKLDIANLPSQLLSELHPSVTASSSKCSVPRTGRKRERQGRESKQTRHPEQEVQSESRQEENVEEHESVENLYSEYYRDGTRTQSTPGRVETTHFFQDTDCSTMIPSITVHDTPRHGKTKI